MLPIDFNIPTIVLLALIVAWAVWAVRRIVGRGLCDCGDHCGDSGCGSCSSCASRGKNGACASCSVADKMVADLKAAPKRG